MSFWTKSASSYEKALQAAVDRSLAVITFDLDGTVLSANDNFLVAMGYDTREVVGRHHRQFMPPEEASSGAYRDFWQALRDGTFQSGEFRRLAKGGREVWLRATYNPVLDRKGRAVSVVKIASDITQDKLRALDDAGQIAAIHRSQAAISFAMDGTIIEANANFLAAMGYSAEEIVGRHHSMFMQPDEAALPSYAAFWQSLRRGEFQAAEYCRVAKGGRKVWIRATYNPILSGDGRPAKVVKFAVDVTAEKLRNADYESQIAAIKRTQAVISFTLDGIILDANENFLKATGYTLEEVKDQHHRIFVERNYAQSDEYKIFWERLAQGVPVSAIYQRFARVAARSGYRPPTIRFSMLPEIRGRS